MPTMYEPMQFTYLNQYSTHVVYLYNIKVSTAGLRCYIYVDVPLDTTWEHFFSSFYFMASLESVFLSD